MEVVKVQTNLLRDLYFEEVGEDSPWEVIEESQWVDEGKYSSMDTFIIHNKETNKFYSTYLNRTGDHWQGYDVEEYNESRELTEVERKEVTVTRWVAKSA